MFKGPFTQSMVKRAQEKGAVKINTHNLRNWATDKHKTTDDRPYGGGKGMVLKVDVVDRAITDLKSCMNAGSVAFSRDIAQRGYYFQGAFYSDGMSNIGDDIFEQFIFIASEKSEPFCTAVYMLGEDSMQTGRQQYERALETYKECLETGEWPAYPGSDEIEIPPYALEREEITLEV